MFSAHLWVYCSFCHKNRPLFLLFVRVQLVRRIIFTRGVDPSIPSTRCCLIFCSWFAGGHDGTVVSSGFESCDFFFYIPWTLVKIDPMRRTSARRRRVREHVDSHSSECRCRRDTLRVHTRKTGKRTTLKALISCRVVLHHRRRHLRL